jgi:hypothetical protein
MFNAAMDDIATTFNTAWPVAIGLGAAGATGSWDAINIAGADIASSGTINLTTATGPNLTITGTTTITTVTLASGNVRFARANAAFQLTASANLIINGSASTNYTTTAGDLLIFIGGAGSVTRVWAISGSVAAASNAEVIAGTVANKYVSPATAYFPTGYISGFLMTPAADAANDFSMAVGSARSSDDTTNIVLGSALIKQIDATWVVGTNQGGRFFTTLTAGSQIYAYVIKDPVNNLVDWGYSDNASNPTGGASYPAAYTVYVRVAGFWRSAGSVNQYPRVYSREADLYDGILRKITTPTYNGFGTPTGESLWCAREGDRLVYQGYFTTGTATAAEARASYGMNGVANNVITDATKIAALSAGGLAMVDFAGANNFFTLVEGGVSYATFGIQGSAFAGLSKVNGNTFGTGAKISVKMADIPIAGWAY